MPKTAAATYKLRPKAKARRVGQTECAIHHSGVRTGARGYQTRGSRAAEPSPELEPTLTCTHFEKFGLAASQLDGRIPPSSRRIKSRHPVKLRSSTRSHILPTDSCSAKIFPWFEITLPLNTQLVSYCPLSRRVIQSGQLTGRARCGKSFNAAASPLPHTQSHSHGQFQ
ncbi:hypothetical protein BU26DRAFT_353296 [Trematosphaeria pertusa]|uniref:Uncharacterized protein n=1 Tax=Trematosphaeria pertusa TaxID=390896 RepID=A0A6A6IB27_9PLEO|nr:uncharacterized protein BU26DRAFT_353296 [Trematosphaeria pertusa]KAF2247775.1 hypothetical protein BU26DRAFT_353296 [Trematosphaeria pertusa]